MPHSSLFEPLEDRRLMSGTLPIGTVVSGAITQVGAQERWTFDAHQNDVISWAMTGTATQAGFDAYFQIYQQSGDRVDARHVGGFERLTLPTDGTYTIVVGDSNNKQTGEYTLCVEGIHRISPNPASLAKGGIVSGALTSAADMNQWVFDGKAGDLVTIAPTDTAVQAGFDGYFEVYDPSGNRIEAFHAGGRTKIQLNADGQYLVTVRDSQSTRAGKYTIGFEGIAAPSPNPVKAIHGGIVSNAIEASNDVDQIVFTGKAGDLFAVCLTGAATVAGFDAYAEIYAPSGTRIDAFHVGGQHSLPTLPETGTYVIEVHDSNYKQTGTYTIGLESVNPFSPNPGKLPAGATRTGANESVTDVDQYTFFASQGDDILVNLTSTATDRGYGAFVEIFDESGQRVFASHPGSNTFAPARTGTFMAQVHDANFAQRGKYSLTLNWQSGTATAGISGSLFNDKNGNGRQDANESPLKGWQVYLDRNNNKRRDAGESVTTTDFQGVYAFYGLTKGAYNVRAVAKSGHVASAPSKGYYKRSLTRGQASINNNFGFAQAGKINGRVFADVNGNKRRDAAESLISGGTVFLDANDNGKLDAGERSTLTDSDGNWRFDSLKPGDHVVRLARHDNYAFATPKNGRQIASVAGGATTTKLFGVRPIA